MEAGAVSDLRFVKQAVTAARLVLERTSHSMLAGLHATQFAAEMGLPVEHLETNASAEAHTAWLAGSCQPNFRRAVVPDPRRSCGPYTPEGLRAAVRAAARGPGHVGSSGSDGNSDGSGTKATDTISMAAMDASGRLAVACSTNGATHKVPGRVGDGSTPGAGEAGAGGVGALSQAPGAACRLPQALGPRRCLQPGDPTAQPPRHTR